MQTCGMDIWANIWDKAPYSIICREVNNKLNSLSKRVFSKTTKKKQSRKMLKDKAARPTTTEWMFAIIVAQKQDNSLRFWVEC